MAARPEGWLQREVGGPEGRFGGNCKWTLDTVIFGEKEIRWIPTPPL